MQEKVKQNLKELKFFKRNFYLINNALHVWIILGKWDAARVIVVVHLLSLRRFGKNAKFKKKRK